MRVKAQSLPVAADQRLLGGLSEPERQLPSCQSPAAAAAASALTNSWRLPAMQPDCLVCHLAWGEVLTKPRQSVALAVTVVHCHLLLHFAWRGFEAACKTSHAMHVDHGQAAKL